MEFELLSKVQQNFGFTVNDVSLKGDKKNQEICFNKREKGKAYEIN